jgi:hypothetical protein
VRAAYVEAEEAKPAATGKLLRLTTLKYSSRPKRSRKICKNEETFWKGSPVTRWPLDQYSSPPASFGSTITSVSRPPKVREMLPTLGRLSAGSLFPQYLTKATLG